MQTGRSFRMGSLVHSHNLSAEVPRIGPAEGRSGFRACEEDRVNDAAHLGSESRRFHVSVGTLTVEELSKRLGRKL
jgi:hypothetical protein